MNVCQFCVTTVEGPYFRNLGKGFAERFDGHHFVTLSAPEPAWVREVSNVSYRSLGVTSRALYPLAVIRLASYLRKNKIDLLHTHLFDAALIGIMAAKLAGIKAVVVSRHHLDEAALLGNRFHHFLETWSMNSADAVPVPSNATRKFMEEHQGHCKDNVWVVPYGFDFDALSAEPTAVAKVREEFDLEGRFVIGCVGRFFKNKGHRFLFEAVAGLASDNPDLRVMLLGDGDRKSIQNLVAENGLQDRVIFAGYRSDVQACMGAMDLLVHPSLSESFGQVIVEAMAVGTPVVVTSVGGVPEIVEHGVTGLVVPPADSQALRDAIADMVSNEERRRNFGVEGRKRVREKFSVEQFVRRNAEMYESVITARSRCK